MKEKLEIQYIFFTELNLVKWNAPGKRSKPTNRYSFILKTTHPNLFWYKRDFDSFGSGHNCFYYKKDKIKISSFMLYDNKHITELLQSES